MRAVSFAVVALVVAAAAGVPLAQEPAAPPAVRPPAPDQGFTLAARLGAAFPFGSIAGNVDTGESADLSDDFERALPFTIEAGFRVRATTFGLYYQWAPASLGSKAPLGTGECDLPGQSCDSARVKRFGAQITHSLGRAGGGPAPWLGGAIGWEWAEFEVSDASGSAKLGFKGFDLTAQGGVEWEVSPRFFVGPYTSVSLGRYSELQIEQGGMSGSIDIDEKRWHEWFQIGVRGRIGL
jgi:hypothetical protein